MKQTLFMIAITAAATFGAVIHPFWAVLLYYFFAVLRPQYIWSWSLPPNVPWSEIAAAVVGFGVITHINAIWRRLDLNIIVILMVIYIGWTCAGVLTAFSPAQSLQWIVVFLKIAMMAVLAVYLIDRFNHLRVLAAMILISSGYIAFEENWKYVFDNRLDIYHFGYGGLDNNGAALMLAVALPLAYSFFASRSGGPWRLVRWLAIPAALCIIHTVLVSYSRGAMVAGIVGLAWIAINHRHRIQAFAGVALTTTLVLVLAGVQVRERFLSIQDFEQDGAAVRRINAWGAAWEMAWNRPMFGYGLRNSSQFISAFSDKEVAPTVHSQYLQVAADSGIPALFVLLLILGLSLYRVYCSRRLCRAALQETDENTDPQRVDLLRSGEALWLGFEAAFITLLVGQLFLSLEVAELPWLLYAVGAVSPALATSIAVQPSATPEPDPAPDKPLRGRPSQTRPALAA